jgi:hypothetical protein
MEFLAPPLRSQALSVALWGPVKREAMAQAKRQQQTLRPLIANLRVNATERAHLQQVASARSTTVSDLIRDALRREGALPAQ